MHNFAQHCATLCKFAQNCAKLLRNISQTFTPDPQAPHHPGSPTPGRNPSQVQAPVKWVFSHGHPPPHPSEPSPPSPDGPETTKSMRRDNLATIECVTYIGVTGHWTPCVGGGGAPGWWVGGGKGPCPDPLGFRPFRPAFAGNRGSGLVVGGYWAQGHACVENYHMSEICGAHSFWSELLDLEKKLFGATVLRHFG